MSAYGQGMQGEQGMLSGQAPEIPRAQVTPPAGGMGGNQEMVPLKAPDGSTRMVPSGKVPYYQQRWLGHGQPWQLAGMYHGGAR